MYEYKKLENCVEIVIDIVWTKSNFLYELTKHSLFYAKYQPFNVKKIQIIPCLI